MDTELTPEMQTELDALRWALDMVEDHERDAVRARLEHAGRVLVDGKWTKPRRADPKPIAGEIGEQNQRT